MKSVDRDNEVNRIISAFRLNPFEQLGVRFDAMPEEIRRQYRKVSIPTRDCVCPNMDKNL
jgi:DnaJ family protein C protein 8